MNSFNDFSFTRKIIMFLILNIMYCSTEFIDPAVRLKKIFNNEIFIFKSSNNVISHPYSEFILTGYANQTDIFTYKQKDSNYYHENYHTFGNIIEYKNKYKMHINEIYPDLSSEEFFKALKNGIKGNYENDFYVPELKNFSFQFETKLSIPAKCYNKDINVFYHGIRGFYCYTKYVSGTRYQLFCDYIIYWIPETDDGILLKLKN